MNFITDEFDDSFNRLIDREAGFQQDPRDKGNWTGGEVGKGVCKGTKFGISAASYPGEDIEHLTLDRAKFLCHRDYWGPAGCDAVPTAIKADLLDTAYNSGVRTAVRLLQRAVGVDDDGVLGPNTLQALQSMDPERLLARFNGWRLDWLNDNPTLWATYGRGLTQRIAENLKAA